MESRQVLCCGAKTWSLVIGWVQTITSGIFLALAVIGFFVVIVNGNEGSKGNDHAVLIVSVLVTIATLVVGLIGGIILILGVKQENAGKLKIWLIIQIVFLVFSVLGLILAVLSGSFGSLVRDIITILIGIFCIWVVNIHRFELLSAGIGRVAYGGKV